MAIKLIKACKELNISMSTFVGMCANLGYSIKTDPNLRVTDEIFAQIAEKFNNVVSDNRSTQYVKPSNKNTQQPSMKLAVGQIIQGRIKKIVPFGAFVDCGEMDGLIHLTELDQNFVNDLHDIVREGQSVRVKILKIDVNKRQLSLSLKQANQQGQQTVQSGQSNANKAPINTSPTTSDEIKNIWKYYIDIQDYLLQQRSQPININPESIDFKEVEGKFSVEIDDVNEAHIKNIVESECGVPDFECSADCIQVDSLLWQTKTTEEKQNIQNRLSQYNADLDIDPSIEILIKYGKDIERVDQMTLSEIRQLDKDLQDGTDIYGCIDDTAAFISKLRFDQDYYIYHYFGDHALPSQSSAFHKYSRNIRYINSFIQVNEYEEYSKHIGLVLTGYRLLFRVNDSEATAFLNNHYEVHDPSAANAVKYNMRRKAYMFERVVPKRSDYSEIINVEVHRNIKQFLSGLGSYYNGSNVEVECEFNYRISRDKLEEYLCKQLYTHLSASDIPGCSLSVHTRMIGIDFNWRTENLNDKIEKIVSFMPGLSIELYEDHKFKCRVLNHYVGYENLKKVLSDTFENIRIKNDELTQVVRINLVYEPAYYNNLKKMLVTKIEALGYSKEQMIISDNEIGKVRLSFDYHADEHIKDIEDNLAELRTADFAFSTKDGEIPFGRLLRVDYPMLYFDVTYPIEKHKSIIDELLENKSVDLVVPILTGDREKLSRLKTTYQRAQSGTDLLNGGLSKFMFDSSLATKTSDISTILNPEGHTYADMQRNLLNAHINKSQTKAILKAISAQDLAVIQGPPGTGKSTAISELIWQLVRMGEQPSSASERILLTSETNLAVDNAIARTVNNKTNLVKPIRFGDDEKLASEGLQFSLKLMKEWVEDGDVALENSGVDDETSANQGKANLILKNWLENISRRSFNGEKMEDVEIAEKWHNVLRNPSEALRKLVFKEYLEGCNVIGATCSSIGVDRADEHGVTSFYRNYTTVFPGRRDQVTPVSFTTVIQDESSKATPAELIQPFVYGKRAVVIGDHRQLPPMLDQEEIEQALKIAFDRATTTEEANQIKHLQKVVHDKFRDLEISHFQRLYENIDTSLKGTFNMQYRMHPDINEVIEQFYVEDGGLKCGWTIPSDQGVDDPDFSNPASRYHGIRIDNIIDESTHVLFVNTQTPEMIDGTSRVNYGEIDVVDSLLTLFEENDSYLKYLSHFSSDEEKQIGIISFYGKQVRQLQKVARKHSIYIPTRVSTVDRFQGMERNIVIVSMVRSDRIQTSRNQLPNMVKYPKTGGYCPQKSLGFAESPNRLNVALSRARRLLVIIGNEQLFSRKEIYRNLFMTIRNNPHNRVIEASML